MGEAPEIRYSARIGDCRNLGPHLRAVLWVQGCCFHCEGCIASGFTGGEGAAFVESPEALARWYLAQPGCEGLTISGGEPMLQAGPLADMIDAIRRERDAGVIVYTGFTYEALRERAALDAGTRRFLERIDLMIDGPYVRGLDVNQPYQGSSNQRLLALTDRYAADLNGYYAAPPGRSVEMRVTDDRILLVGVPSADQARIWADIKKMGAGSADPPAGGHGPGRA